VIKVSLRLKAIADYIEKNAKVIDIGCDHALLAIMLVKSKIVNKVIAVDISRGAINQAQKNIEQAKLESKIALRLGNGLFCLASGEVDTIVLAGLGHHKIISILKEGKSKLKEINHIVIQSNTNPLLIRKYLCQIGFYIEKEKLVSEKDIIYPIISFKRGKQKYTKKELILGPHLIKENSPLFKQFIKKEIAKQKQLLLVIPFQYIHKRRQIKNYLKNLQVVNDK
jgi:tRNA (adenine22-N1)-methyltransferase